MPLFNVEARRVIEGEIEIEAAHLAEAVDKVRGMNDDDFMRKIDMTTDEIEVTNAWDIEEDAE